MSATKPNVLIFYHYFHPDDVVSARLYTDLAVDLVDAGFSVSVVTSNRSRTTGVKYGKFENYKGVKIRRLYRPDLDQARFLGRIINALWMIVCWSVLAFTRKPDIVIVGTDPILSLTIAFPWQLIRRKTRLVHWCFDIYPDAAVAAGMLREDAWLTRSLRSIAFAAYRQFDAVVDIGACMRPRLPALNSLTETLTPWALTEPGAPEEIDLEERDRVFGQTDLAILYSGNFGEAHSYENVLRLARRLRGKAVIAFSVRGDRVAELKQAVTPQDTNIRFVDFASEDGLARRLACADIHLVTLQPGWEGIVVPSKFFGALAIGRPVLFDGPAGSAIAQWVKSYKVGWHLMPGLDLESLKVDDSRRHHAYQVYQAHFSRQAQVKRWQRLLEQLIAR